MTEIRKLYRHYRSFFMYAVFGFLTTLVNMAAYYLCFNIAGIPNVISAAAAWILAVSLAFITNKMWVFDSWSFSAEVLRHELPAFFGTRITTGFLDIGIMYFTVDRLHWNSGYCKLISNVLVIIINFIAGKRIVFMPAGRQKFKDNE